MNTLDMRGKSLREIGWHCTGYPRQLYHCNTIYYSHRETGDSDIVKAEVEAMRQGAEMMMIQEYGISWYVRN